MMKNVYNQAPTSGCSKGSGNLTSNLQYTVQSPLENSVVAAKFNQSITAIQSYGNSQCSGEVMNVNYIPLNNCLSISPNNIKFDASNSTFNTYTDEKCSKLLTSETLVNDGKTCNRVLYGNIIVSWIGSSSGIPAKSYLTILPLIFLFLLL
jgi:hypothetical protein